jgi:hypothetical protein
MTTITGAHTISNVSPTALSSARFNRRLLINTTGSSLVDPTGNNPVSG